MSCYHFYDETGEEHLPPCGDPLARTLRGDRVVEEVVQVVHLATASGFCAVTPAHLTAATAP